MLADSEIKKCIDRGDIQLTPMPSNEHFQPCSIDLTLTNIFLFMMPYNIVVIDPQLTPSSQYIERLILEHDEEYVLHPGDFVLGATQQTLTISPKLVSFVEGKSSLGRLGIKTHSTAGLIDPGWSGTITLEITNEGRIPIKLKPGMKICQITFEYLDGICERPYGHKDLKNHYQNQVDPEASRSYIP